MPNGTNITYAGGPIIACPLVYLNFWGDLWDDPTHISIAVKLIQFYQDLLSSNFMNILTQYGIFGKESGAVTQSLYGSGVPNTMTVSDYENIFNIYIEFGLLPNPYHQPQQVFITHLDEKTSINGGGRTLVPSNNSVSGYHDHYSAPSGSLYYAFLSYPLSSDETNTVNLLTQVGSHEFAEMITDPEFTAWTPDSGVTEIGDPCENNTATISAASNTWTVQKLWSQTDHACIGPVPNPIPRLANGPAGMGSGRAPGSATAMQVGMHRDGWKPASHERVLPLPPLHFDLQTKSVSLDAREVRSYLRKLFHPVQHQHVFGNIPQLLRQIADIIDKEKEEVPRRPGAASAGF